MAKRKILKDNGEEILPVTHESAVIDDNGVSLPEKYVTKADLPSSSNFATRNDIGTLSSLQTSNKSNLVAAINELFQNGSNVKQRLVDTLTAKGMSCSINDSWDALEHRMNVACSYRYWWVESVSGATYGFSLNSNGYYESKNKGVANSYSYCKLYINNPLGKTVTMKYINYAQSSYDYGIVSKLNTDLALSYSADSSTKYTLSCKGASSSAVKSLNLGTSSGYYTIKFIKNNSTDKNNDSFQFTIEMS